MLSLCCSFCQHANPADAKYCNECGGALRLKPCVRCDAINAQDATRCHHCGGDFTQSPSTAATVTSTAAEQEAQGRSSVVRAVETIERDLRRFARRDGAKFAQHARVILAGVVLIGAGGAVFDGDRESMPIGTPTITRFAAPVAVARVVSATSPQLPLTKPITVLHVTQSEATSNPVNTGNDSLPADSLPAITPSSIAKDGEPAETRRAKRSPVSRHAGITRPVRASASTRATFPSDDLPSSSFEPPQDRTRSGPCSDGVAALGLCNKQDASSGG